MTQELLKSYWRVTQELLKSYSLVTRYLLVTYSLLTRYLQVNRIMAQRTSEEFIITLSDNKTRYDCNSKRQPDMELIAKAVACSGINFDKVRNNPRIEPYEAGCKHKSKYFLCNRCWAKAPKFTTKKTWQSVVAPSIVDYATTTASAAISEGVREVLFRDYSRHLLEQEQESRKRIAEAQVKAGKKLKVSVSSAVEKRDELQRQASGGGSVDALLKFRYLDPELLVKNTTVPEPMFESQESQEEPFALSHDTDEEVSDDEDSDFTDFRAQVRELRVENAELGDKITELESICEQSSEKVRELTHENAELKKKLIEAGNTDQLGTVLADMKARVASLEAKLLTAHSQNAELKAQLELEENMVETLQEQIEKIQNAPQVTLQVVKPTEAILQLEDKSGGHHLRFEDSQAEVQSDEEATPAEAENSDEIPPVETAQEPATLSDEVSFSDIEKYVNLKILRFPAYGTDSRLGFTGMNNLQNNNPVAFHTEVNALRIARVKSEKESFEGKYFYHTYKQVLEQDMTYLEGFWRGNLATAAEKGLINFDSKSHNLDYILAAARHEKRAPTLQEKFARFKKMEEINKSFHDKYGFLISKKS